MAKGYEIGVYYFPNWHPDARNEALHGKGWTEWDILKGARPHFPGHKQPKVPLWGYEDESKPEVMEKKIAAALEYGISSFIFDWYWYEGKPFLERALEEGFLKARNAKDFRFSLMWCNHHWMELYPKKRSTPPYTIYPCVQDEAAFIKLTDYVIEHYFSHPSYWRVDGGLYFCIYDLPLFLQEMGGIEEAKRVLNDFRERVKNAGLGKLHLNGILIERPILRTGEDTDLILNDEILYQLGFDSMTSYVWFHYVQSEYPIGSYQSALEQMRAITKRLGSSKLLPYYPNVSMGWDSTPRCAQTDVIEPLEYPFCNVMDTSPKDFEAGLQLAKDYLDSSQLNTKMFVINAWNEWTEGSYLEPDTEYGYAYLEAIKKVFEG